MIRYRNINLIIIKRTFVQINPRSDVLKIFNCTKIEGDVIFFFTLRNSFFSECPFLMCKIYFIHFLKDIIAFSDNCQKYIF